MKSLQLLTSDKIGLKREATWLVQHVKSESRHDTSIILGTVRVPIRIFNRLTLGKYTFEDKPDIW